MQIVHSNLIKSVVLFSVIGVCLATTTLVPKPIGYIIQGADVILAQQPVTPTPRLNCSVPPYPAAAYGRNPQPTELASYFEEVGLNQLGNNGPNLPDMDGQSPYIPCVLLKAMAYQESRWQHFEANYDGNGYTRIGHSCDYGAMQVVSGMAGGGDFDANRANAEIPYNIGTGAQTLIKKWKALKLDSGGYPGGSYLVGQGNPKIVEDWYYAIWAYNSFSWFNNPNNNCASWLPGCGGWFSGRPPFNPHDATQDPLWYPYQELIWGYAAHPPTYNSPAILNLEIG